MSARRIFASSFERYNGGAAVKRKYGSSTVTRFYVGYEGDGAEKWAKIIAYGRTPGERKTAAIEQFKAQQTASASEHRRRRRRNPEQAGESMGIGSILFGAALGAGATWWWCTTQAPAPSTPTKTGTSG